MTKTNGVSVCLAKTQISLGIRPVWSESSLCAQWVAKADLSLHWVHTHFVDFVMSRLKCHEFHTKWEIGASLKCQEFKIKQNRT